MPRLFTAVLALIIVHVPVWAGELTFTFIGNESVHITDGKNTIITDFPYQSGAFGYMEYDMKDVPSIDGAICLVTHVHTDHWSKRLFAELKGTKVIGPPSVTKQVEDQDRVIEIASGAAARLGELDVLAIATPHNLAPDHFSYLVVWHGIRIYFPGDTETPAEILHRRDIDVMFITPWLIRTLDRQNLRLDCDKLVVYHQKTDEEFPEYQGVVRMKQGEQFTVSYED